MFVIGEMAQPAAVSGPALRIVAKAVAEVPTCTERLEGKRAATTDAEPGSDCAARVVSTEPRPPVAWLK